MKETVNVNIGSEAFTLDQDAHRALGAYLDDIRSRLPETDVEVMLDIEMRIAELFCEKITSPMQVVTLDIARNAMNRMGSPSEFGPRRDTTAQEPEQATVEPPRKLYRSRNDRSIAGICGGLSEFFDIDATLLRVITLFLILFGGLSIWVYILLWIIVPEAPARKFNIYKNQ